MKTVSNILWHNRATNEPVGDVYLAVSLVEHDSGNIDKYKEKVAAVIVNLAGKFAAMEGVPAETLAADQGLIGDVSLGLVNVISGVIGADDDPYTPGTITVDKRDILPKFRQDSSPPDQFPLFTLQRDDDPRTIPFTHKVIISGTDQGGDLGEYAFYFRIMLKTVFEII